MAPTALRHPALALGVVAALGAGIAAPAAAAATAEPAPQAAQRGLLGDLLGGILAPVTGPLGLTQVTDLVTALTDPVDALLPSQVADLLEVLTLPQLTQIVKPETIGPLLEGLQPILGSLTGAGATPSTAQITAVLDQLTAILGVGLPGDADGQAVLGGLLDQVTSLLGLPGVRDLPVVGDLVTVLEGVVSQLPDPLKTPVQALITAAAGTPKSGSTGTVTDPTLAALLALLTGVRAPTGAAPAATAAKPAAAGAAAKKTVRAKITSVKLSKNRKTLTVRVTCPTTATTGCRIAPKVTVAGKSLKLSGSKSLKRGKVASLKGKVAASTVKKLRAKGGKAVVRVSTTGSTSGAVSKTLKIRRVAR